MWLFFLSFFPFFCFFFLTFLFFSGEDESDIFNLHDSTSTTSPITHENGDCRGLYSSWTLLHEAITQHGSHHFATFSFKALGFDTSCHPVCFEDLLESTNFAFESIVQCWRMGSGERANMAEKETSCTGLELSDGGHVHLKSTWETANFSIVVLDGVHAWSRTVSAREVVSIATSWKIDVGEFMNSARAHLCRQHPTSNYFISAEKDAHVVQLSFTIDDLLEGDEGKETLNFGLRLTRISEVGAVVRDMLDHLLLTKDKLKEQLAEVETQFQKKLHELATSSEPEPSITLSLARPSAHPRRQSSLVEPRLLDFTKVKHSEERDTTRSVCTLTAVRAHDQLHHDSTQLQDHDTKHSAVEMERDHPGSLFRSVPMRGNESRAGVRNNDVTVRAREAYVGFDVPLSPNIMRVLNNLSAAGPMHRTGGGHRSQNLHDGTDEGAGGCVKITEMRSPARREDQPQRSFKVEANSLSIDLSGMRNSTGGRRHLFEEEGSRLNKCAGGEVKEGSDEEPSSKVTVEDAHLSSGSGLRAVEKHEVHQEEQKLADKELVRNGCSDETRKHCSLESLWSKDIIGSAGTPSPTMSDKKSLVADQYARQKTSCSHPPMVGRKRTVEDREDGFNEIKTSRSVKLEVEDPETYGSRGGAQKLTTKVKHEVVDLDQLYPDEIQGECKKRDTIHIPNSPPRTTIADLLKTVPVVGGGRGKGRPSREIRRQRCRLRGESSPSEEGNVSDPDDTNVLNFHVPDPDYFNFDKERTEDLILPNQVWAVYDEKDGFPRVWAFIDKVSRHPKFQVSVTWLMPSTLSADAESWSKASGYSISCGKFVRGSQGVLDSINVFSHRMEFNWVARDVVTIYPRKGEVWALYTAKTIKAACATPATGAKRPRFRVVHILEDVEPEKRPVFQVLDRVKGFRTVYKANYQPGSVTVSYLVLFSHRVPAHQLQGDEGPRAANLKGSWDVDPAGLPTLEGDL